MKRKTQYENVPVQDEDGDHGLSPADISAENDKEETAQEVPLNIDSALDQQDENEISVDDAIERLGMGRFQISVLFASGLCFAADAMQVVLLSFLTVVLKDDWQLTSERAEGITSCLFAGSMVGTMILGPLADSIGRRPVFLFAASEITLFGLGVALAPNYWTLIAMIFLVGVGVGGLTVPFDVLSEFIPTSGRGTNLLVIEYFWTVGCLFVVLVAYMTLHSGKDHWRYFVAICALPCLVSVVIGYLCVPESARWLVTKGRTEQAMAIIRQAATRNGIDVALAFPPDLHLAPEPEHKEAAIADLLQPKWRKTILLLWGTWFFFPFGYYGTIMTTTRVFADHETSSNSTSSGVGGSSESYDFDYSAIFLSSAAELIGTTLVVLAVDRVGRIPSQMLSYGLAGISLCLLYVLDASGSSRLVLIALVFSARIFEMAGTCVTWVSTAEVLTTDVRGTGHSTANAVARLGAFFCPYLVEGSAPLARIGIIMLFTHAFTVACVSRLPETKGRDLGVSTQGDCDDGQEGDMTPVLQDEPEQNDHHLI